MNCNEIPSFHLVHDDFTFCKTINIDHGDNTAFREAIWNVWILIDYLIVNNNDTLLDIMANDMQCVDCRLSGSLEVPEYWSEHLEYNK